MSHSAIRFGSKLLIVRSLALATVLGVPLACDRPAPEHLLAEADSPARPGAPVGDTRPAGIRSQFFTGESVEPASVLHDPRGDSIVLAWATNQLSQRKWADGYARLVRIAGHSGRIPRRAVTGGSGMPGGTCMDLLVADLLGATLVDAQDELWGAWASLERAGLPDNAVQSLTEPPPWPPASVAKYLRREGEHAMALTETLAAELAPDPAARAWLIRSWLSPGRSLDDKLLAELAGALDGRLCREPRFRAWLRAEWTAWARQRYRRVARWAEGQHAAAPE
jgi:hypothetical protein